MKAAMRTLVCLVFYSLLASALAAEGFVILRTNSDWKSVGSDTYRLEFMHGVVLDDDAAEHMQLCEALLVLRAPNCAVSDDGFRRLMGHTKLTECELKGLRQVSSDALKSVGALNKVTNLSLLDTDSADADYIVALQKCTALLKLGVGGAMTGDVVKALGGLSVSDLTIDLRGGLEGQSWGALQNIPKLNKLSLNTTRLADSAWAELAKLPKLTVFTALPGSKVPASGLKAFSATPAGQLFFLQTRITDDALAALPAFKKLFSLTLHGCGSISRTGLDHLLKASGLSILNLSECPQFVDDDVLALAGMEKLQTLYLLHTNISDAALETLRLKPGLSVMGGNPDRVPQDRTGTSLVLYDNPMAVALGDGFGRPVFDKQKLKDLPADIEGLHLGQSLKDTEWNQLERFTKLKRLRVDYPNTHKEFAAVANKLTSLETLVFTGRSPGGYLGGALKDHSGLRRLGFYECADMIAAELATYTPIAEITRLELYYNRELLDPIAVVPKFKKLRELYVLGSSMWANDDWSGLETLPLETLVLFSEYISEKQASSIAKLASLKRLEMAQALSVDDRVIESLLPPGLEILVLVAAPITDASMKAIGEADLVELSLSSCCLLTDEGVKNLVGTRLRKLDLAAGNFSGAISTHLATLTSLESLCLAVWQAGSGEALAPLNTLGGLKRLDLRGSWGLSGKDVREFAAGGCTVVWWPGARRLPEITISAFVVKDAYWAERIPAGVISVDWYLERDAKSLAPLERLRNLLKLTTGALDMNGLKTICKFKNLVELRIEDSPKLDGSALDELAGLKKLEVLRLVCSEKFEDKHFKKVGKMASLRRLEIVALKPEDEKKKSVRATAKALESLAGCASLEFLGLYSSADLSKGGLGALAKFKSLSGLSLYDCGLTDEGLADVAKCTALRGLWIEGADGITTKGAEQLESLPKLELLWLVDCPNVAPSFGQGFMQDKPLTRAFQ